jgi:hypothetical protein
MWRRPPAKGGLKRIPRYARNEKSTQQFQKCRRIVFVSGKYIVELAVPEMPVNDFTEHAPEIGSQREIAAFIELFLRKARPFAIDSSTLYRAADNEHYIGMPVVGATCPVLTGGASEL